MFSLKFILELFMVVSWGIVAFSLIMLLIEKLGKTCSFGETSLETLNIKKTKVCQLVLDWCHENIGNKKTVKPRLEVIYYKNKKKFLAPIFQVITYAKSMLTIIATLENSPIL